MLVSASSSSPSLSSSVDFLCLAPTAFFLRDAPPRTSSIEASADVRDALSPLDDNSKEKTSAHASSEMITVIITEIDRMSSSTAHTRRPDPREIRSGDSREIERRHALSTVQGAPAMRGYSQIVGGMP